MEFLPAVGKLFICLEPIKSEIDEEAKRNNVSKVNVKPDKSHTKKCALNYREPDPSEGIARKQQAVSEGEPARIDNLDQFLLCEDHLKEIISVRETMKQEATNKSGEHQVDLRSKKVKRKKEFVPELVDLNSLLIHCSEAVSANDYNRACELIKQLRKQSSPKGDPNQRLAHYLVNALEARLCGTGSEVYHELLSRLGTVTDFLKAYRICHAVCRFLRASYYFTNQTILNVSKHATKIHIIDFGIHMGFLWPSFFENLSRLESRSPKIRITGIDFPDKGFRPGKLVEETGRRLSEYAQRFNIHLKYQGIAANWENIRIGDLKIEKDETLIVNCLYRLESIADETIDDMSCPQDKVLRMIKEIKPCVFIHEIFNF
ncbi:GRAS transcription factor [Rhynchospora pubera]|uniref:GRAS transcription factor n=1 Tax=Rhynchospora pubera TaxID=906938 RepID=A0AAV8E2S7_9POAL|nr:GRAS transcription factor [Rhynchospora pubera]